MTNSKDKCCVMGSLVDARNVGTHKSVKLTVHVPAELAMKVFESFGWPTMAEPVAVAIARLNSETTVEVASGEDSTTPPRASIYGTPDSQCGKPSRVHKSWQDLAPAQQAGVLCNEMPFYSYLYNRHNTLQSWKDDANAAPTLVESCARLVRHQCAVETRSEIKPGTAAAAHWKLLVADYRAWMREPEFVP